VVMRAGDCARQSLVASPLFLSVRVWQLKKPLQLLVKEATKNTVLSLLTLGWVQPDCAFHMLLYKAFSPNHLISCTSCAYMGHTLITILNYHPGIDFSRDIGNTLIHSRNSVYTQLKYNSLSCDIFVPLFF